MKKDFKKNPAAAFISIPDSETAVPVKEEAQGQSMKAPATPPPGYKLDPRFVEVKSKRIQLLLQPSTVDALKSVAKAKGLSMNEAANEAIKTFIKSNQINGGD